MRIFGFRKKVIFDVEDSLPDPIEQKFRFRRRVMRFTFLGALVLLAIPVTRDRLPSMHAATAARQMADLVLESRLQATKNRSAVVLRLNSRREWEQIFLNTEQCEPLTASQTPIRKVTMPKVLWAAEWSQKEISKICFHPTKGLLLDSSPQGTEALKITASPEDDTDRTDRARKLMISQEKLEII
jgi:hypothetical protein